MPGQRVAQAVAIPCPKCGVPREVSDTPDGRCRARKSECRRCADKALSERSREGWRRRRIREA